MWRKSEYAETDDTKQLLLLHLCFETLSSVLGKHVSFLKRAQGAFGNAFSLTVPQVKPDSWSVNCHHANCLSCLD